MSEPLLAAIELGGTKTIVTVARGLGEAIKTSRMPTEMPGRTIGAVGDLLESWQARHGPIAALGIAAFGPVRLDPDARDWGYVLPTTKPGWTGAAVAPALQRRLGCPVAIETDVNAAALAEARLGAGQGCRHLAYVTVGTGVGVGLVLNGAPHHGTLHPELGHLLVRRDPRDAFAGICTFHGDCLEGLASGPAIQARLGRPLDQLGENHAFRDVLVGYLAQLSAVLVMALSVERIVMGGGVLTRLDLLPAINARLSALLAGYLPERDAGPAVVAPALADAGLHGALLMAQSSAGQTGSVGVRATAGRYS